jgi:DnaK suppressor protein
MSDLVDQAQNLEAAQRDTALARQREAARVRPEDLATPGICSDCDEAIPEQRLAALPNATRCLFCQAMSETGR